MSEIIVYEKPTCSKCREADKLLRASGQKYTKINYYRQPLTVAKLRELLDKAGLTPRAVLRTREKLYREMNLAQADLSDDELLELLIKYPDLLQRPIVERGARAVLARPTENINALLQEPK